MPSSRCAKMTYEGLPTLQEVLNLSDRGLLARVVMADQILECFPLDAEGGGCEAMGEDIAEFLGALCSLDLPDVHRGRLVLYPEESFSLDGRTGMIRRRLAASLFDLDHLPAVERARKALGKRARSYKRVGHILGDKRKRAAIEAEELEPRAYASDSWEKMLACPLWLPEGLCLRERYMVLASVFWEMEFYRFANRWMQTGSAGGCRHADIRSLMAVDQFDRAYRGKLTRIVAVLNYNACIDNCETLLGLAGERWK